MSPTETSDGAILDLLRQRGPLGVPELTTATAVTATAVRQRLNRLLGQGLIEKAAIARNEISAGAGLGERSGDRALRGRPSHKYTLTEKGRRQSGNNYTDLATALWEEIRAIPDVEVRKGLLQRLAGRLAGEYFGQVRGNTVGERMQSVRRLMIERQVPFDVTQSGDLPVLTALACPYPGLAERDRGVCAMEKMLLSEVLGETVSLTACRLDGASCCTFEATG